MKINTILTERAIIQEQILADSTYREFYKLGVLLREYKMSQQDVQNLFKQVASGAAAGGNVAQAGDAPASNRTVMGKGADVAGEVKKAFDSVASYIGKTGVVKGADRTFDAAQQKIMGAVGNDSKIAQALEWYRELSKVPGMGLAAKAIIVGLAGLSGAGLGAIAIASGITFVNQILQGNKFSSAVWKSLKTAGLVGAIQVAKDFLGRVDVGQGANDAVSADNDALAQNKLPLDANSDNTWDNSLPNADAATAAYNQNPDPSTGLPQDPTSSRSDYTAPDDIGSATEYKVTAADGKLGVGGIAQKYPGISAQDIIDYNNLSPDGLIKPGQVLQIPEPNLVSPASTNIWDRYEGPGPKDMDAVSDRANNIANAQNAVDTEFYKNKPDDFGVPARSNDAVGNGMPGQFDSDAAGETIKALKPGEQMSLAKDWAQKMGMDPSDIKVSTTGSVPTTINGQPVPQEFYSPAQLKLIDGANQLRGGLNQSYVNPKSMMREWIDVDTTARMWMLRESIGKSRGGVYLTNEGVRAVFKEVVRRSVVNEGPWLDKLKGFNKKASDVIGKVTKPLGDIARAGWDSASNKITYGDLDMNWRRSAKLDKEASVDSEQVKQFLKAQGVNDPLIDASFKALGLDKGTPATTVEPAATPTEPGMEKYAKQPSWADPKSKDYVGRREVTRRQQAQTTAKPATATGTNATPTSAPNFNALSTAASQGYKTAGIPDTAPAAPQAGAPTTPGAPATPGTPGTDPKPTGQVPSAQGAAEEPSSFWDAAGKDIANTFSGASDAIERGRNAYIGGSVADQTHPNKNKGNGLEIADRTGKKTKYIQQGDKWLTQDGTEVDPAMAAMLTARAAQQATTATTPTATTPTTATTATTPTATTPTATTPATTATTPTATTPTATEPAQATATTGTTAAPAAPTTAKLPTATSSTAGQPSKISYDPKMFAKKAAAPNFNALSTAASQGYKTAQPTVAPTATDTMATTPTDTTTAKTRTGGKVAGQVSQTPNAIRKRAARAGTDSTSAPSAFGNMAAQLAARPTTSSTGGTTKGVAGAGNGVVSHTANPNNPNRQAATTAATQTTSPFAGLDQRIQQLSQKPAPVQKESFTRDFGAMLWTKMRDSK